MSLKINKSILKASLCVSISVGVLFSTATIANAQVNTDPATLENIDCGGKIAMPHFSRGTFRRTGEYQIHARGTNWCNNVPNELTLATQMFRSSWRGWIPQQHIGNTRNPITRPNRVKSSPNVLVSVAECSPGTRYRWRVHFENSAIIQGEPWASVHPVMFRETPEEITCGLEN